MKKYYHVLALALSLIMFAACQPGEKSLVKQPEGLAPQPQSQPQTASSSGGEQMAPTSTCGNKQCEGDEWNSMSGNFCPQDCPLCPLPNIQQGLPQLDNCLSPNDNRLDPGEGCKIADYPQTCAKLGEQYRTFSQNPNTNYSWLPNWYDAVPDDGIDLAWHYDGTPQGGSAAQQGSGVSVSGNAVLCKLKFMRAGQGGVGQAALLCGGGSPFVLKNGGGCPYSDCGLNNGCNPNCATNPDCPSDPDCNSCSEDCSADGQCNVNCHDCNSACPEDPDCPACDYCCAGDGNCVDECEINCGIPDSDCEQAAHFDYCCVYCGDGICHSSETNNWSKPSCSAISNLDVNGTLLDDFGQPRPEYLPCFCPYDCSTPNNCSFKEYVGKWKKRSNLTQDCDWSLPENLNGKCVMDCDWTGSACSETPDGIFEVSCCNGNLVQIT
ncbi:MAG: hypothetical protein D6797_03975 [Bdellovibrio sp.]|nr:MAG: hypothetical protein D6797_03975 [Bdellovibrio sp.]